MNLEISNTEIKNINQILHNNTDKYFFDDSLNPSKETIEKLKQQLLLDLGNDLGTRAINIKLFNLLGIRSLYDGFYQLTSQLPPEKVICGNYAETEDRLQIKYIRIPNKIFLIKAYQGNDEKIISRIASNLDLGPKICGPGVEVFEEHLGDIEVPKIAPYKLGIMIGNLLKQLHNNNIIYGDSLIDHFRYDKTNNKLRLIDFGYSFIHDGKTKVSEKYLTMVIRIMVGKLTLNQHSEIKNNPEKLNQLLTSTPQALKLKELERLNSEIHYLFKSQFQRIGIKFYSKNDSIKKTQEGIEKGYMN